MVATALVATARRRASTALVALAAVTALVLSACTPDVDLTAAINTARTGNGTGLAALPTAPRLAQGAQAWAQHMAESCPNTCHSTLVFGQLDAENVGRFPVGTTVDQINGAFLASPPHRANMMNPQMRSIGVAVYDDGAGNLWVVEQFSRSAS